MNSPGRCTTSSPKVYASQFKKVGPGGTCPSSYLGLLLLEILQINLKQVPTWKWGKAFIFWLCLLIYIWLLMQSFYLILTWDSTDVRKELSSSKLDSWFCHLPYMLPHGASVSSAVRWTLEWWLTPGGSMRTQWDVCKVYSMGHIVRVQCT